MGFGVSELLIILVIVALLFGTKKLRNIGGDLGSAINSFRKAVKDPEDNTPVNNSSNTKDEPIESELEPNKTTSKS